MIFQRGVNGRNINHVILKQFSGKPMLLLLNGWIHVPSKKKSLL
jgi:hypothetical protein